MLLGKQIIGKPVFMEWEIILRLMECWALKSSHPQWVELVSIEGGYLIATINDGAATNELLIALAFFCNDFQEGISGLE
jgi:hypothetical protein